MSDLRYVTTDGDRVDCTVQSIPVGERRERRHHSMHRLSLVISDRRVEEEKSGTGRLQPTLSL
jgi:hypothetical protein